VAQHDSDQHVLLPRPDAQPGDGLRGELVVAGLGEHGDLLDGVGVLAKGVPDTVAQVLARVAGVDGDPRAVPVDVDLAPLDGVRVDPGVPPPGSARRERLDEHLGHPFQVGQAEGPARDAPHVELVGRRTVEPVDRVPSIDDSGCDEQHVVGGIGGEGPQAGRDHRRGVAAKHAPTVEVPGVAHVPAHSVRREAEPVVVVRDGDHPRPAVPSHLAAPCLGEAGDGRLDQELDGVCAFGGVGEITDGQVTGEPAGRASPPPAPAFRRSLSTRRPDARACRRRGRRVSAGRTAGRCVA
jgi:hypothetical protein